MLDGYGGCKSWIELEPSMDISAANPVLEDAIFEQSWLAFGRPWREADYLASGSRRRELLEQMDVKFRVLTAEVGKSTVKVERPGRLSP